MTIAASRPGHDNPARPENSPSSPSQDSKASRTQIIILSSVMLSFMGIWSTAAVVLCDLASTAFYIGGVVESQIGKAAPWFIMAVMIFSYAVRSVYIESCSMFVRGGVYRIVRQAMGHGMAKIAVSALMFDYILTGPISAVSAGQYLIRLFNSVLRHFSIHKTLSEGWGAAAIAIAVVVYFFQANLRGIQTSSSKALKIMWATTAMAIAIIAFCVVTLAVRPETRTLPPWQPDLSRKTDNRGQPVLNEATGKQQDPLGWVAATPLGEKLRPENVDWLSLIGTIGIVIAFGHSILAMSGEETLAQVYREVKAPKLRNFKWAAIIVFAYSLMLTGLISFFAVMIIPDAERTRFQDNLISGLALHVVGPEWVKMGLNIFVVIVGFLILSGAANTSIVGANAVLNRVAEDGVLPAWFQSPQKRYGTTWRLLTLIAALQIATIVITGGNVILLGEAYAFGVVWSLTLMCLSMFVLRFTEPDRDRAYRVPVNIPVGGRELPVGLLLIVLILAAAALANFFTKTIATMAGVTFTVVLLGVFAATEWYYKRRPKGGSDGTDDSHQEQFKLKLVDTLTAEALCLDKKSRKLIWLKSPDDIQPLEREIEALDPEKEDLVVALAHRPSRKKRPSSEDAEGSENDIIDEESQPTDGPQPALRARDRKLLTALVDSSERVGKPVTPILLLSDDPDQAVTNAAQSIGASVLRLDLIGRALARRFDVGSRSERSRSAPAVSPSIPGPDALAAASIERTVLLRERDGWRFQGLVSLCQLIDFNGLIDGDVVKDLGRPARGPVDPQRRDAIRRPEADCLPQGVCSETTARRNQAVKG